jgi:hypothetical protein
MVNQKLRDPALQLLLAFLITAWALAIGLHDLVLSEHDHDALSPEWTITQVWSSGLPPEKPHPPAPLFVALLVAVLWVLLPPRPVLKPCVLEFHHSPPRPPTLANLHYRGPPPDTCAVLNS